ncbi:antitoxin VbhA family protein [Microbacterium sp. NPDC055683]
MAEQFDVEERWPELFAQLDGAQRNAVRQSLAAAWHEGWVPNREDVENLTDEARGAIDAEEYLRRVREAALRAAPAGIGVSPH